MATEVWLIGVVVSKPARVLKTNTFWPAGQQPLRFELRVGEEGLYNCEAEVISGVKKGDVLSLLGRCRVEDSVVQATEVLIWGQAPQ